jgi:hypothetical protein
LINCNLGSLCEKKEIIFFNFFFWTSELHISQAFGNTKQVKFQFCTSMW